MFGAQYKDVKRIMQLHEAPNVKGEQVRIHEKNFSKNKFKINKCVLTIVPWMPFNEINDSSSHDS